MNKKILFLLCILIVFTFTACGKEVERGENADMKEKLIESTSQKKIESDDSKVEKEKNENVRVVYFSATGTTKEVAGTLAEVLETDAVEIIPQETYSFGDLDYNNDNCRANKEMNDDNSRPDIKNDLNVVKECDMVYIGYPIWWGTAPRIIQTFFETYDLIWRAAQIRNLLDLQEKYKDVNIVSGKRFSEGVSEEEIREWMNEKE